MSSSQSSLGYYNTLPSTSTSTSTTTTNTATARFVFAKHRPWCELVQPFSFFTCPYTLGEATARVKHNLDLSLLWQLISMIVFLAIFVAWSFLYFLRDRPFLLFHITVDDHIVLALLSIIAIVALVLTNVWLNVIVSLTLG